MLVGGGRDLRRHTVKGALASQSIPIADMLKIPLLLTSDDPDGPSLNRVIGVYRFAAADQDDCYPDAVGSVAARFIQQFYGCQSQLRSTGAAWKGDPAP